MIINENAWHQTDMFPNANVLQISMICCKSKIQWLCKNIKPLGKTLWNTNKSFVLRLTQLCISSLVFNLGWGLMPPCGVQSICTETQRQSTHRLPSLQHITSFVLLSPLHRFNEAIYNTDKCDHPLFLPVSFINSTHSCCCSVCVCLTIIKNV